MTVQDKLLTGINITLLRKAYNLFTNIIVPDALYMIQDRRGVDDDT